MIFELCSILLVSIWMWNRLNKTRAQKMIAKFPGPLDLPIFGTIRAMGESSVESFKRTLKNNSDYAKEGSPYRILLGTKPVVVLSHPKDFEIILSSPKHIDKGFVYDFLLPWLGTGLLTSTGPKWKSRRKILTPGFHFKILEDFLETFNANGKILVERLRSQVNGPAFDIAKYITLCALDNICETAMGVKVNAQVEKDSEYVQAIRNQTWVLMQRAVVRPWLSIAFFYNFTKLKNIHEQSLKILHNTTNNVIKIRRAALEKERKTVGRIEPDDGIKTRLAFLDILVEAALEDPSMTDEDIREEVDTFMFEGHDTTSSAINFTLWLLSRHQDVQNQVFRELKSVFPVPNERITMRGLQDLKYLERVIKETLRLYPTVPGIGRNIYEDITLSGGLVIPAGTSTTLSIITCHTNPNLWPDPFKFDPERFTTENIQGRHPYAYVPFSAGPRNCIGQKFAMLEIKSTLCEILRAFKLLPGTREPNLQLANELILISANGIPVKLEDRNFKNTGN